MKKNKIKKLAGLLVLTISIIGVSVSCKNKNPEQRAEHVVKKVSKKLDLNKDQKEKLNNLKDKMLAIHKSKESNKEDFHKDVKKLLTQERISEVDVKSLLDRKRNDIDQILPEVLPELINFHASLNTDQKEKLVKFVEKFGKRRRGKKKHH